MASIQNLSRYTVSVKHRDDLYREFPYSALCKARMYREALAKQGLKAKLAQLEDKILVRIRNKGYAKEEGRFSSMAEAEAFIHTVESERRQGVVKTSLKHRHVTFVDVLRRYIEEEGASRPGKSWESVDKYRFQKLLRGATGKLDARELKQLAVESGASAPRLPGALAPTYPWMQKPFCDITTADIEGYLKARLQEGLRPASADRELDLLSAVFGVAINVWEYPVARNPMAHVRRPKYFNERDRRLVRDEEARLLLAARREDARRCQALYLDALGAEFRRCEGSSSKSVSKYRINQLRRSHQQNAEQCGVVPVMEAFILFQLRTAARRGETLELTWSNIDLDAQTAYFPMTKNGRPRRIPLRSEVVAVLERLPRAEERVFALSIDEVKNAWQRMLTDAGIDKLNIHDLRHEAISAIAETGKFSLIDIQAISGHRDVRMLLRYSHLCATKLASRLDEVFAEESRKDVAARLTHKGRTRLPAELGMSLREVVDDTCQSSPRAATDESAPPILKDKIAGTA
jgi:integrase